MVVDLYYILLKTLVMSRYIYYTGEMLTTQLIGNMESNPPCTIKRIFEIMSNNWSQQPNNHALDQHRTPSPPHTHRSGDRLRGYRLQQLQQDNSPQYPQSQPLQQEQDYRQYSPISQPPGSQPLGPQPPVSQPLTYNPYSLLPSVPQQQLDFPHSEGQWEQIQQQHQGFLAGPMQMVRTWSGKFMAARAAAMQQPQAAMVLYRTETPAPPLTQPKRRRWKRSHAVRVSLQMHHRRMRWKQKRPKGGRIGVGIAVAFLLLIVILVSSGSAYAYSYYQSQLPRLQGIANQQILQTTHIYDRNGVQLADIYNKDGAGRRTYVEYKNIPQIMQDAMIAAEDHTFWTNSGIDPQGILRAASQYSSSGSVQSGGSTITQQLIKNLTGDSAVTLDRKLPEAALAIGLTQQYPKTKILEIYLNIAPFGSQDLGIEAAAEDYFHVARICDTNFAHGVFSCVPGITQLDINPTTHKKDPILGLARASLLAGMPQNPPAYDPTLGKNNVALALARQNDVLNEMASLNMSVDGVPITADVIQQAETLTAKMTFTRYQPNIKAPHFVQWVIGQLETALGNGDPAKGTITLLNGGFNIRTTIDLNLETFVEKAVQRHLTQPEYQMFLGDYGPLNRVHNVNDSAVVVMNSKDGEVLAMDGSANYASNDPRIQGQFNAATSLRSPGSTWKPLVYVTAFEQGWYPGIVLPDVKTYFPNGGPIDALQGYIPPDYGGTNSYSNTRTSIRSATANSRNVPAVKALMYAGIDNVADTARRFGITALDDFLAVYNKDKTHAPASKVSNYIGPAFALGTMGVPLVQMVGAYQVFANQGNRVPPQGILDIWDNYGNHLYHYDVTHPHAVQVISPQLAYMMTSVLADEPARYPEFLNDHVLSFNDWDPTYLAHQVAAKTGTTDNFVDNWTIGYTPNVVVGVWSGNADNSIMKNTIGLSGAAPIWHSVMEEVAGAPCNIDGANINFPCNAINFGGLHLGTQRTFPIPTGIQQVTTSSYDGLRGSGIYDWMLDGEAPTQSGVAPTATCTTAPGNGGTGTTTCPPTNGTH